MTTNNQQDDKYRARLYSEYVQDLGRLYIGKVKYSGERAAIATLKGEDALLMHQALASREQPAVSGLSEDEVEMFNVFKDARGKWMLKNQNLALSPSYNDSADLAGIRALKAALPQAARQDELSPCEHSNLGTINLAHDREGAMHRIAATRNAVVIQVFDELRNKDDSLKTATYIECCDMGLKDDLLALARGIIKGFPLPPSSIVDGGE